MAQARALERLQALLADLFQFDLADLDFGIYRLFKLKRDEVRAFIVEHLPRSVDEAFGTATREKSEQLRTALDEVLSALRDEFPDRDIVHGNGSLAEDVRAGSGRTIRELVSRHDEIRSALDTLAASDAQKVEVFNHLFAFFSRYYDDGDFVPHRRYGAREQYAVPYNREETHFHWANRGQHYVKSGEVLEDYAFRVGADISSGERRVRFVLVSGSVPPGDTKGDARYFFPRAEEASWDQASSTFSVPFEYRRATGAELERYGRNPQEAVIDGAVPAALGTIPDEGLRAALATPVSGEEGAPSLLKRHLIRFVRRNTSDYFVHRDLRGFLTRELEFYIKGDSGCPGIDSLGPVFKRLIEEEEKLA